MEAALSLYEEGIREADAVEPFEALSQLRAKLLSNRGILLAEYGRFSEAQDALEAARELYGELGDERRLATVAGTMGFVAHSVGRYGAALRYYQLDLEHQRRAGASGATKAVTYNNYAALLHDLGETGRAAEFYRRARERHLEAGEGRRAAVALANLATLEDESGQGQRAAKLYRQAAEEARADGQRDLEAVAISHLGQLQLDHFGRAADAKRTLADAHALATSVGDDLGAAVTLLHLAEAHRRSGDPDDAERDLRRALAAFEERDSRDGRLEAMRRLAMLVREDGRREESLALFETGLELVEEARDELAPAKVPPVHEPLQRSFFGEKVDYYDDYCLALVHEARGSDDEDAKALHVQAFDIAERRRARELADRLGAPGDDGLPLGDLWATQERLLDDRTALLSFVISGDDGACFCVTRGELAVFEVGEGRDHISAWVHSLRRWAETEATWPSEYFGLLHRAVMEAALEWIRERSARVERLLIIPDGPLHLLPFACLPSFPEAGGMLIDDYELEFTPSVAIALELKGRRKRIGDADGFLGFGNPLVGREADVADAALESLLARTMRGRELDAIPGSAAEVEGIAAMLRERGYRPVDVLLGEACNKQEVMRLVRGAFNRRWVHFATHGLLDLDVPELCGLLFSSTGRDDPYWRFPEIAAAAISADLVVASACDTANGKTIVGEGVLGLARAFLLAGVASVCASLWKVPDEATAELMMRFYAGLLENLSPSAALRAAQLAVREGDLPHPVNWAGFVVFR